MGSQVPQSDESAARRTLWSASMIFKVVAVLLILHATCGTYHTATAKQLSNDELNIDDTFDIDQFEEEPAINRKIVLMRNERDLDKESLLKDELQPIAPEEDADGDSSSWLAKGVKRVRRELSRLFGKADDKSAAQRRSVSDDTKSKHVKHPKHHKAHSGDDKKHHNKHQLHGKHRAHRLLQRQRSDGNEHDNSQHQGKQLKKLAKKHSKRQSDYDGDGSGDGDEDFEVADTALWHTYFIITEPWTDAFSNQLSSEFLELHRQLEIAFRDLFHATFSDEDFEINPTLKSISPSNDKFKVYALVELELPAGHTDFKNVFENQIARYHRLGGLGVESDERFYFKLVSEDLETDAVYNPAKEYDGEGGHEVSTDYECDPEVGFRCADGSFIACESVCNNHLDCYDGDDEDEPFCQALFDKQDAEQEQAAEERRRVETEEAGRQQAEEEEKKRREQDEERQRVEEERRRVEEERLRAEEEEARLQAEEERLKAEEEEARRQAEEEDKANELAEKEEEERRREEESRRKEEEEEQRRRDDVDETPYIVGEEEKPYDIGEGDENTYPGKEDNLFTPYPTEEETDLEYDEETRRLAEEERIRIEQEKEDRRLAEEKRQQEEDEHRQAEEKRQQEEDERRRIQYEELDRRRAEEERQRVEQEEEEYRRVEEERRRAEEEEERRRTDQAEAERRRIEYEEEQRGREDEVGRDPYEGPEGPETPTEAPEVSETDEPERNPIIDEGSGDDYGISTDRSTVFTDAGCRGDATYTCSKSGYRICDEQRCDDREDCPDGEDEENCGVSVGGGDEDLAGRGEDDGGYEHVCSDSEFKCDGRCLPLDYKCNGREECLDATDELNCPVDKPEVCQPDQYRCRAGNCIDSARRCDRVRDCPDGDDEDASCRCAVNQFRCRNGDCVSGNAQCNGYQDCRDGSDEEDCSEPAYVVPCSGSQFRCNNGQCINAAARCDGYTDCADSSDEISCRALDLPASNPELNLKTYPESQIIKESREVIFRCRDEGPLRARVKWTRPGGRPLPIGSRDNGDGRLEIPNIRVEDSGQYICEAAGYPRHVSGQQVTVHLTVEKLNPDNERPPTACRAYQATCRDNQCIDKSQICDGTPHCSDGSDEESCSHGLKCQPNQFMCRNSRCIDRIWRCDGEDDCFDNSDEDSCDPEPSGAPCRYDEFQCRSGHCIPKNFQCDDTNDCMDGSDEIGCMAPAPIRPPPPYVRLQSGEALNITCVGTGVPVPLIVWRLNWGHVPEKCVSKNYGGTATLFCPNMESKDQGAYSCEILNPKGRIFVTPDTQVTIDTPTTVDVCPAGFFNMLARRPDECIDCFCFGISKTCKSANLFNFAIQPPISSHKVKNVELNPYSDIIINDVPVPNILSRHHGVQFRVSDVGYNSREQPYLALPNEYMGNQLKSYGGYLRYDVNYMGNGRSNKAPDVIITGNGLTLTQRVRNQPEPNVNNKISVQFSPGNWYKTDGRRATRGEVMMVLANVDNILIRLSYIDATEREVELTNIVMDSAGLEDQGLGSASLVEKCACPPGYIGDSCESCAPGYVREKYGPWLGRCVPFVPEPCQPGTYGDPARGIPCRPCPCPQTGSSNFASGCQLSPDGDVTCDCHEGYTGRRCEFCAAGYQGNPLIPGGSCHPIPESTCNAEGTYYPHPNGTCECKPLVMGPRCDTCAPESFHLNSFTYTGCIECFCSGLTKQCSSSSWYRDQISSSFGRSGAPHGFELIRDYKAPQPSQVNFQQYNSALTFSQQLSPDPLYWSLPAPFLGDKITAYGGKLSYNLSYNPLPGGLMSRNTAPDVVISGEDITIIHYRKAGVNPNQPSSYSVPMIESAWQRPDGQVVNREHLLMALSKIDAIYIKATYTTSTKDGQLTQVSLDIATQNNIGTPRAYEVEECRCPVGYIGLSCERCAPGYKRLSEGGLYLGVCIPCECNGHSDQCDAETGTCINCEHNTAGEFCDRCAPGYVGNASGGTPNDCSPDYDEPYPPPAPGNQTVECGYCNRDGTASCNGNYCACKPNVIGPYCDQCRPGTYGLSERNPDGCEECYCSGKSTKCSSAVLYRQLIPVDFILSKPLLTDEEGSIVDEENLSFDIPTNMFTYNYNSYTQKYWSIRGSVLGNQLYSYGGHLSYKLDVESYGNSVPGSDVILIGNGMKLVWSRPREEQDNSDYRVRLHEDENWQRKEFGRSVNAGRLDFMSVLSNLEHILIRATPKIPTTRTSIRDVILESAVEHRTPDAQQAIEVEVCACPAGYSGTSCEKCEPLHYKDNYASCVACPCREDTTDSCFLQDNEVNCRCKPGYSGQQCQIDDGYTRPEPPKPVPTPLPDYQTQITVSIAPPEITIIPIGGSLTLSCTGRMAWNDVPVFVSWFKLGGRLPNSAEEDGGVLRLYNLQIYDSGVYVCRAVNNETKRVFEDKISITITEDSQRTPSQIVNLPQVVTFEEYQRNEIYCEVSGHPTPTVTWTRVDGRMSLEARTEDTRLIFEAPRKSDEGRYRCQASNEIGIDEKYSQVYVRIAPPVAPPPPRELIYIDPPSYTGESGRPVRLTCQPTTSISLIYEWNKDGYPLYRQRNVIINGNTIEIRESTPRDSGLYTCIGIDLRGRRNYTNDAQVLIEDSDYPVPGPGPYPGPQPGTIEPVVKRLPDQNRIIQGQDFSITCEATGSPYPSIKWTKVHEALADNVQQTGNVLRIINARPENRGMYLCIAENIAGSDESNTIIDVEPRESPTVDVHPPGPQSVNVGTEAMLYCSATGIPDPSVQWRRVDGKPLSPRSQEISAGYIMIREIQLDDSGDYECIAQNDVGRVTAVQKVIVMLPPVVTLEPNDEYLSLTEGDELKVTCTATGVPNPIVQWVDDTTEFNRGLPPSPQHNQAFLEKYRVDRNDAKTYKCIASNEAGTAESSVTVDIRPRRGDAPHDGDVIRNPYPSYPRPPKYDPPQNVYRANKGEAVRLTCDLGPELMTRWQREDGRPLPPNSYLDQSSLIITEVEEQNSGKYICNAMDNRGSIVSFVIAELILVPIPHITFHPNIPIVVTVNDNIDVYCEVTGEQPIEVSWHTDHNRPLTDTARIEGQYLRFNGITPADAGRYYCSASNRYGNTTKMAEVTVNRRGPYLPSPRAQVYNIREGDDVTLNCDVQSIREPIRGEIRYEWRRQDGRPLPRTALVRDQRLYLRGVQKPDEGRYVCESYSTGGGRSAPSFVDLNIKREYNPYLPDIYGRDKDRRRRYNARRAH